MLSNNGSNNEINQSFRVRNPNNVRNELRRRGLYRDPRNVIVEPFNNRHIHFTNRYYETSAEKILTKTRENINRILSVSPNNIEQEIDGKYEEIYSILIDLVDNFLVTRNRDLFDYINIAFRNTYEIIFFMMIIIKKKDYDFFHKLRYCIKYEIVRISLSNNFNEGYEFMLHDILYYLNDIEEIEKEKEINLSNRNLYHVYLNYIPQYNEEINGYSNYGNYNEEINEENNEEINGYSNYDVIEIPTGPGASQVNSETIRYNPDTRNYEPVYYGSEIAKKRTIKNEGTGNITRKNGIRVVENSNYGILPYVKGRRKKQSNCRTDNSKSKNHQEED